MKKMIDVLELKDKIYFISAFAGAGGDFIGTIIADDCVYKDYYKNWRNELTNKWWFRDIFKSRFRTMEIDKTLSKKLHINRDIHKLDLKELYKLSNYLFNVWLKNVDPIDNYYFALCHLHSEIRRREIFFEFLNNFTILHFYWPKGYEHEQFNLMCHKNLQNTHGNPDRYLIDKLQTHGIDFVRNMYITNWRYNPKEKFDKIFLFNARNLILYPNKQEWARLLDLVNNTLNDELWKKISKNAKDNRCILGNLTLDLVM